MDWIRYEFRIGIKILQDFTVFHPFFCHFIGGKLAKSQAVPQAFGYDPYLPFHFFDIKTGRIQAEALPGAFPRQGGLAGFCLGHIAVAVPGFYGESVHCFIRRHIQFRAGLLQLFQEIFLFQEGYMEEIRGRNIPGTVHAAQIGGIFDRGVWGIPGLPSADSMEGGQDRLSPIGEDFPLGIQDGVLQYMVILFKPVLPA